MSILQAMVLGVIQGITEFLPISSSGHLIIFPELFGWPQQGLDFDVAVHLATLGAVVWVFRNDLKQIAKGIFQKDVHGSLGWKIIIATIPVALVGFFLSSFLDSVRTIPMVAGQLIVWGIFLFVADLYVMRRKQNGGVHAVEKVGWPQAVLIGLMQTIALVPGASRSGVTITAGLFSGLDRKTAAKFSFLLSIPAIFGAGLLTTLDVLQDGFSTSFFALFVGCVAAFISGIFAIRALLSFVQRASYGWFAAYRILLGIGLLLIVFF